MLHKETSPSVSIIILNWNGWNDTIECLESVFNINYPNFDVIVADNGSENDSIEKIKEYADGKLEVSSKFFSYTNKNKPLCYNEYFWKGADIFEETIVADSSYGKRITLIKNGKNFGYAEGNNIAIKYALKVLDPEYILLLNNDTIVDPLFLKNLVEVIESDKSIAFAGPKNYCYNHFGRTDVIDFAGAEVNLWKGTACHIGANEIDHGQYDRVTSTDYITGSCLLARKDSLSSIGLLDPIYFLYWEDVDWGIRAKKAGYKLIYVPNAKIWHKVSASQDGIPNKFFFVRNGFIFIKKNANKRQYFTCLLYFFGINFWLIFGKSICFSKNLKELIPIIKGAINGIRFNI